MSRLSSLSLLMVGVLVLAACQQVSATLQESSTIPATREPTVSMTASPTETPLPTPIQTSTSTALPLISSPMPVLCSPLDGYRLDQMAELVSNPFNPPQPGSDDPHQAIDLADRQAGSSIAVAGRLVRAVMNGKVAAVIRDRFPYGNALLVESPLENLPEGWTTALGLNAPAPTPIPNRALTCPEVVQNHWQAGQSLYVLFAHMQQAPEFQLDDLVACGQGIGNVGSSGNALNPHLHLEIRLGPKGARFSSLAHYDNRATLEEMDNYCTWRVRGIFRLVDPLLLLGLAGQ